MLLTSCRMLFLKFRDDAHLSSLQIFNSWSEDKHHWNTFINQYCLQRDCVKQNEQKNNDQKFALKTLISKSFGPCDSTHHFPPNKTVFLLGASLSGCVFVVLQSLNRWVGPVVGPWVHKSVIVTKHFFAHRINIGKRIILQSLENAQIYMSAKYVPN